MVWRGLQAARFISKDDVVGGTDYRYWRAQLKDLTDDQLKAGLRASGEFSGYMTWSAFKNLCLDATRQEPCHRQYKALPNKRATPEQAREFLDQLYRDCPDLCPDSHKERLGL